MNQSVFWNLLGHILSYQLNRNYKFYFFISLNQQKDTLQYHFTDCIKTIKKPLKNCNKANNNKPRNTGQMAKSNYTEIKIQMLKIPKEMIFPINDAMVTSSVYSMKMQFMNKMFTNEIFTEWTEDVTIAAFR